MGEPLITGGYILLSRKTIESEIWYKPPLYIKVWIYLLSKAQHQQFKQLKRGQLFISIPEIQEACCWYVGFRKHTPTKDQIFQIIEWLRKPSESNCESNDESNAKATMITTTKATHGMLITIENFNVYQTPKNYESNDESNDETATKATTKKLREQREPDNINKNDKNNKNVKNDKNNIYSVFDSYTENENLRKALIDFSEMRNKIKSPMTDRAATMLLNELDKLTTIDDIKIKILDNSILNNWKSVYPLKNQNNQNNYKNNQGQSNNPFRDIFEEALASEQN